MYAARQVRWARRHAGISQRELSRRTGVAQSTISRVETGELDPGVSTFRALLRGCGYDVELAPARGYGVDRGLIAGLLALPAEERLRRGVASANAVRSLVPRTGIGSPHAG